METEKLGIKFAESVNKGDCVALIGELGSGKTCFTQGMAKGIGVKEAVTSPTFKIISEYAGDRTKFYHIDFYRLVKPEELTELGLDDLFYSDAITVVEWADKFLNCLPENFIEVRFSIIGENKRIIEILR